MDSGVEAVEGPEAAEGSEAVEGPESAMDTKLSSVTVATTVIPAGVSATGTGSVEDLNVEGDFDLQEIAGTDTPPLN